MWLTKFFNKFIAKVGAYLLTDVNAAHTCFSACFKSFWKRSSSSTHRGRSASPLPFISSSFCLRCLKAWSSSFRRLCLVRDAWRSSSKSREVRVGLSCAALCRISWHTGWLGGDTEQSKLILRQPGARFDMLQPEKLELLGQFFTSCFVWSQKIHLCWNFSSVTGFNEVHSDIFTGWKQKTHSDPWDDTARRHNTTQNSPQISTTLFIFVNICFFKAQPNT